MAQQYDNTNQGLLYRNMDKEEGSRQPDFRGQINIDGAEYWISGWNKPVKEGSRLESKGLRSFVSLSAEPKDEQQRGGGPRGGGGGRSGGRDSGRGRAPAPAPAPAPRRAAPPPADDFGDDDIPF